jgi:hypothetical protein
MTASGLLLCYEMAIPFFGYSLAGDAFYATALFGMLALAEARFPTLKPRDNAPEIAVHSAS